jgi:capsular polysaccharide biosynthesis protein
MELRQLWRIFRRRWLVAVIPALVVLVLGILTYNPPGSFYSVGVRFIVGQEPTTAAATEDEERYYNWLTSEYIVNGLTDWIRGERFAAAVSAQLLQEGLDISAGEIRGGLSADNTRSMMTVILNSGRDQATVDKMINAIIAVLISQNAEALPQLGDEPATLVQLDTPIINQIMPGIRDQLDLPLRLALALGAGIGLVFLVEYLDPTVRGRDELEAAGWVVLGEIPKK